MHFFAAVPSTVATPRRTAAVQAVAVCPPVRSRRDQRPAGCRRRPWQRARGRHGGHGVAAENARPGATDQQVRQFNCIDNDTGFILTKSCIG